MVRVVVRGLIYDLRTSKTYQKQAEHDSGGANRPLCAEELAETEPSDDRLYVTMRRTRVTRLGDNGGGGRGVMLDVIAFVG